MRNFAGTCEGFVDVSLTDALTDAADAPYGAHFSTSDNTTYMVATNAPPAIAPKRNVQSRSQRMKCQGYKINIGEMFGLGGNRLSPCDREAEYRVFVQPPKDGDDGCRYECRNCRDVYSRTLKSDPLRADS